MAANAIYWQPRYEDFFRELAAWPFYFTPVPVDDWNYIPGQETIQESNSSLPWTKAVGKAWSKEVSGYTKLAGRIRYTIVSRKKNKVSILRNQ